MMYRSLLLIIFGFSAINSLQVDNAIDGDPLLDCGPNSIGISFNVKNRFDGRVFVKGQFNQLGCRNDSAGGRVASINLPFDTCSLQRTRSLSPRGMFVSTTVVISFHPEFITKGDRAYWIQCFYMEADKIVSTEIEVAMLTTGFQTQTVPMPVCRYEILDGGPGGTPVRYVIVGQQVYHKWTCDTETVDIFCMKVHSCYVDDGAGDKVTLLNEAGCAQDRYLLRNLEYLTDLMAGQEAHVFKYADRAQLFFQCQVAISVKEPNQKCPHPECPDPPKRVRRSRKLEFSRKLEADSDLLNATTQISTSDFEKNITTSDSLFNLEFPTIIDELDQDRICMSSGGFSIMIAIAILIFLSTGIAVAIFCSYSRNEKA